MSVVQEWR